MFSLFRFVLFQPKTLHHWLPSGGKGDLQLRFPKCHAFSTYLKAHDGVYERQGGGSKVSRTDITCKRVQYYFRCMAHEACPHNFKLVQDADMQSFAVFESGAHSVQKVRLGLEPLLGSILQRNVCPPQRHMMSSPRATCLAIARIDPNCALH